MKEVFAFPNVQLGNDVKSVYTMGELRRAVTRDTEYEKPERRIYIRFPRAVVHTGHLIDPVSTIVVGNM